MKEIDLVLTMFNILNSGTENFTLKSTELQCWLVNGFLLLNQLNNQ